MKIKENKRQELKSTQKKKYIFAFDATLYVMKQKSECTPNYDCFAF